MKIIKVEVQDQIVLKQIVDTDTGTIRGINSTIKIPTGNINSIILDFNFITPSALQEGMRLFAIFDANYLDKPIYKEIGEIEAEGVLYDTSCFVPEEILQKTGKVSLGIYGFILNEDESLKKRVSLVPVTQNVIKGSYNKDAVISITPTPNVFEIYFEEVKRVNEDMQKNYSEYTENINVKFNETNQAINQKFTETNEAITQKFTETNEAITQRFDETNENITKRADEIDKLLNEKVLFYKKYQMVYGVSSSTSQILIGDIPHDGTCIFEVHVNGLVLNPNDYSFTEIADKNGSRNYIIFDTPLEANSIVYIAVLKAVIVNASDYELLKGEKGEKGETGEKGEKGDKPIITIVDGIWYVDGESTGQSATVGFDLSNYYNKTQVYNKQETENLIDDGCNTLANSIGLNFVRNSTLNNYYTKTETDNELSEVRTRVDTLEENLENTYNKTQIDEMLVEYADHLSRLDINILDINDKDTNQDIRLTNLENAIGNVETLLASI